jgi:hypothetical protein
MFLLALIKPEANLLGRFIAAVIIVSGFLFLFRFFSRKRKGTKQLKLELLNFDEYAKRRKRKRRRKNRKNK